MKATRSWTAALALGALLSTSGALAQDEQEVADREARAAYTAGAQAYEEGRYEDALRAFRHAYELSPRPALLFNIGQSLDRLRRDEEALTSLEAYLAAQPEASNRAEVERRIEVLRDVIRDREQGPEPLAEPGEAQSEKSSKLWILGVVLGAVALAVGATVVIVATQSGGVQDPIPGDGGRVVSALVSW